MAGLAESAADGEAVEAREHDVEDDEVVCVDVGFIDGVWASGCDVDGVGLLSQAFGEHAGGFGFVFDQQESHSS